MQTSITPDISHRFANFSFLCACMVVISHVEAAAKLTSPNATWLADFFGGAVCSIAVPCFFLISGFFLAGHVGESGWWTRELRKRVPSLLVPFLLWCLFYALFDDARLLVKAVVSGGTEGGIWSLGKPLEVFGLNPFGHPMPAGHLWYIRGLLLFIVAAPVLFLPLKRRGVALAWLAVLLLLWAVVKPTWREGLVAGEWGYLLRGTFSLEGVFCFVLGAELRRRTPSWHAPTWLRWCTLGAGVGLFAWVSVTTLPPWVHVPAVLLTAFGLWWVTPTTAWPAWLTQSAFPMYLLHLLVLFRFPLLHRHIPGLATLWGGPVGYLLQGVSAILLCVALTVAMRRFLPKPAKLLFGGR